MTPSTDYARHEHHDFLAASDQALHDVGLQAALVRLSDTLMAGNQGQRLRRACR